MAYYLNSNQLHVLTNAFRKPGYSKASALSTRKEIRADLVELLYVEGYLSKRGKSYCANRSTEAALQDHDIELDSLVQEVTEKPVTISAEDKLAEHIQLTSSVEQVTHSRDTIQQSLLKYAINEAKAGNPWNFVRRQWPELVITDPIDLEYFKRHCNREHALDLRLDDVQCELIEHGLNPTIPEIAIKGSTSPGKGFATALLINIRYHIFMDRIVLISQSSKHAKDVMFAEVATWRKKMRYPDKCETQVAGVMDPDNPKHFIGIANPETGEGLSGGHGKHVMFCFDEASSVDASLPTNARKQASLIVFISNPRVLSGFFYDLYPSVEPDKNQVIVDKGIKRACLTFGGNGALNVRARRLHLPYGPPGGYHGTTLDGEEFFIAEGDTISDEYWPHVEALIPGQMSWSPAARWASKTSTKRKKPTQWRLCRGSYPVAKVWALT